MDFNNFFNNTCRRPCEKQPFLVYIIIFEVDKATVLKDDEINEINQSINQPW